MILVDLSQVTYSTLMVQLGFDSTKVTEVNEDMLRHMILNCIRSYNMKFKNEYGNLVIACDNSSWRKDVFPYYKANRKKAREESKHDWEQLYAMVNKIRDELKEYSPYRVIHVEKAEADDIIGSLVTLNRGKKTLVLSGDKDFIQLHINTGVKQYDPTRKKWVEHPDPLDYMVEHIIKGDGGDGIPNVMSNDNCLVIGERQKSITKDRLDKLKADPKALGPIVERNFYRNQELIDLSKTPENIMFEIIKQYNQQSNKDRSKLLNYFMNNKLKILTENISDF